VPISEEGKTQEVIVTVGFDLEGKPREVFCADWKSGAAMHSIVIDACILLSRLLQHGDSPADLAVTLCQPPSVLGAIAAHVASSSSSPASGKLTELAT
jgi:hypothetical protein